MFLSENSSPPASVPFHWLQPLDEEPEQTLPHSTSTVSRAAPSTKHSSSSQHLLLFEGHVELFRKVQKHCSHGPHGTVRKLRGATRGGGEASPLADAKCPNLYGEVATGLLRLVSRLNLRVIVLKITGTPVLPEENNRVSPRTRAATPACISRPTSPIHGG